MCFAFYSRYISNNSRQLHRLPSLTITTPCIHSENLLSLDNKVLALYFKAVCFKPCWDCIFIKNSLYLPFISTWAQHVQYLNVRITKLINKIFKQPFFFFGRNQTYSVCVCVHAHACDRAGFLHTDTPNRCLNRNGCVKFNCSTCKVTIKILLNFLMESRVWSYK